MTEPRPGALSARLAKAVGSRRIRAHMAVERWTARRPLRPGAVPASADAINREWLEAALCAGTPGARVERFEAGAPSRATTERRAIDVTYNAAGHAAGLPEALFAKATPEYDSRFVCGLAGAIVREVQFYRHIQPLLDIDTPVCHHADYVPGAFRSIFLFENAVATRGAQFLAADFCASRAQAEEIVRVLARLHSRFWGDPILDRTFTWVADPLAYQHHLNDLIGFDGRCQLGLDRSSELMPGRLAARRGELSAALMRSCEIRAQAPRTLLHTDVHMGNWYIVGDTMGLCDWQTTMKGSWAGDFAYAVTSGLAVEKRRAWEKDLLRLYLDTLALPPGQARPSFDEAWLAYRQQTLHGLYNWLFVAGISAGATAMHADTIWQVCLGRIAAAADDLETLDALKD